MVEVFGDNDRFVSVSAALLATLSADTSSRPSSYAVDEKKFVGRSARTASGAGQSLTSRVGAGPSVRRGLQKRTARGGPSVFGMETRMKRTIEILGSVLLGSCSALWPSERERAGDMFRELDTNGDGKPSFSEIERAERNCSIGWMPIVTAFSIRRRSRRRSTVQNPQGAAMPVRRSPTCSSAEP